MDMFDTKLARHPSRSRNPQVGARRCDARVATHGLHDSLMSHRPVETNDQPRSADAGTPLLSAERLLPIVYDELRRVARQHLAREIGGHTWTTTDLVHQTYLQLSAQNRAAWQSESHFMAVAVNAFRRILVDHARSRHTIKRGGALKRVPLEAANVGIEERAELLVALDDALERLIELDPRQARVVEYRFFAGMTEGETAEILGMSVRTVRRDWTKARAWLYGEIFRDA